MGLISRVSSRTYRKKYHHIMSQAVVWSIVRCNHAFLVKSRKNGGVQFITHPANLKNKNTLKYSGIANKGVAISMTKEGELCMKVGNKCAGKWHKGKGRRPTLVKATNSVGKINPSLKAVARKRVSALLRSAQQ